MSETTMATPQTIYRSILRLCPVATVIMLTLIVAFYTEESWRGKRAWKNCKRALEAKGIKVDWAEHIPPPVPDDQNVFAVPEMRRWFLGKDAEDLRERMVDIYDFEDTKSHSTHTVVAEVAFSLTGSNSPAGFTVLSYEDPKTKAEFARLIKDAVGPYFIDPYGLQRMLRRPDEIQPAKILLLCQKAPTGEELEQFLTNGCLPDGRIGAEDEAVKHGQIESAGNGSYTVTMEVPGTAAELLARIAVLEPQFAVMRQAFQRPYARLLGDSQKPETDLEPAFTVFSPLARTLGAQAQCHLILGRPEEALRDLTLTHDLCRIPEELLPGKKEMLPILINETITAIDIGGIADGLHRHVWREPELAALQDQLKNINFVSDMKQALLAGPARVSHFYEKKTSSQLGELVVGYPFGYPFKTNVWTKLEASLAGNLIPRGWVWQNMVQIANGYAALGESLDSSGQLVFPKKVDAAVSMPKSHPSPYNYVAQALMPRQGCRGNARAQTQVHEALIACALERYRLAHNSYPETLDALVPQFLDKIPADIIGGQPLHYHRTNDGKFVLYSVGWNETDDGGKPGSEDDWVWDDSTR